MTQEEYDKLIAEAHREGIELMRQSNLECGRRLGELVLADEKKKAELVDRQAVFDKKMHEARLRGRIEAEKAFWHILWREMITKGIALGVIAFGVVCLLAYVFLT